MTGLLVERFDRVKGEGGSWLRLPLEDGTQVLGLPPKAAAAANRLALGAANSIPLENLPFSGSPLRGAERELRFRRSEFMD